MKAICLIAARGGSKGVPKKNSRIFVGKPLITHAIESALKSKIFSKVIVSTDDKTIAEIARKHGAEVPGLRPKKLATSNASMEDVLFHIIKKMEKNGEKFDIILNRDCTAPFIRISDMKKSIKLLKKRKADVVVAVYKTHLNPYFNMMEVGSNGYLDFSKKTKKRVIGRQDSPTVFQLTGFQTINVKQFLKNRKIYMPKILPLEIPPETGIMIDSEYEFKMAECLAKIFLQK